MSLGVKELFLFLLILGPGGGSAGETDLLTLISSDVYLGHQLAGTNPEKVLEAARKTPGDPKTSVLQLIAIRWLGENKAKLGPHEKSVHELLDKLSQGPAGFAQDYAKLARARLDGKVPPPRHLMPKGSTRGLALEWFPETVTLFGAMDFRAPSGAVPPDAKSVAAALAARDQFLGLLGRAQREIWTVAEAIGNVRVDRVAVGFADIPGKSDGPPHLFIRITGQGDGKRFAEYLQNIHGNAKIEERKGPRGEVLRVVRAGKHEDVLFILVGDSDFVFRAMESGPNPQKNDTLEQVLDVIAGKKLGVPKGPFARALQASPEDARALIYGVLPAELRQGLATTPVGIAPASVAIEIVDAKDGGSSIRLRASFEKPEEAKKFADGVQAVLKQLQDALKMLPFKVKPESLATLQKALAAVEVQAEGAGATVSARLTTETVLALANLFEEAMKGLR